MAVGLHRADEIPRVPGHSKTGMGIGLVGTAGIWLSAALDSKKVTPRSGGEGKRQDPPSSTATTSQTAAVGWGSVKTNLIFPITLIWLLSLPPPHLPMAALEWHLLEKVETENPQAAFCRDLTTTLKTVFGLYVLLTEVYASRSSA